MFRTDEQQKKLCRTCPLAKTANLIGDSVVLVIVRELFSGVKRFGELSVILEGVSTRTLTQKLKQLEKDNLITRTQFSGKPPRVEYALTPAGQGLHKVVDSLFDYGEKYL